MDFTEALKAMKMGSKVSREAWRGTVSFWMMFFKDEEEANPSIFATYPDGKTKIINTITTESIFATDWWIVT